jgi:hypothetical protein
VQQEVGMSQAKVPKRGEGILTGRETLARLEASGVLVDEGVRALLLAHPKRMYAAAWTDRQKPAVPRVTP